MNDPIQDVRSRLNSAASTRQGRKFQVLLIGATEDIIEAMHTLHNLHYAEVGDWSQILPVPNSTQMMSILTKYRN